MNYWDYIRVEQLLSLQGGLDGDESAISNDEALFIVSHQVYELWFKLVLRELTSARDLLHQNPVPDMAMASAVRSFRRVITIFEQATQHFKVLETLTTRDYLGFRDRLIPASGFQSAQMREIEITLGLDDATRIPLGREGSYKEALKAADGSASSATRRVEARLANGPSLKTVLYDWLARTPIGGSTGGDAGVLHFLEGIIAAQKGEIAVRLRLAEDQALTPADRERLANRYAREAEQSASFLLAEEDPGDGSTRTEEERLYLRRVRAALVFLESYRELPRLSWPRELIDGVIELEQSMLIWRQRHARMVERVIGRRTGTGGSAGVDYLDQTALRYRVFPDVWAVRALLIKKPAVPPIQNPEEYRFRVED